MIPLFRNKRYIPVVIWWTLLLVWLALCLFLTWQTGEDNGQLVISIVRFLLKVFALVGVTLEEAVFHRFLRKFAHFGVFFVAGILFCGATEALWKLKPVQGRARWLCGVAVTLLALLADVPKIWIPGRHLHWNEACLNAAGALLGFLLFSLLNQCSQRRKQADT